MPEKRNKEITVNNKLLNSIIHCLISAFIGFALFIILTLILNLLSIENENLFNKSGIILYIILAVCCAISGVLAAYKNKLKAIIAGSINGIILCLLIVSLLSLCSKMNLTVNLLVTVAVTFGFSIVAAIIYKNVKR